MTVDTQLRTVTIETSPPSGDRRRLAAVDVWLDMTYSMEASIPVKMAVVDIVDTALVLERYDIYAIERRRIHAIQIRNSHSELRFLCRFKGQYGYKQVFGGNSALHYTF